jgi:hypothetical protein
MTGSSTARRAEDIAGQELSYAEVKAIASGNPAVLTLAEADAEIERLNILRKNHADEQFLTRRHLRQLPQTIAELGERLSHLTSDMARAATHAQDPVTIGSRTCSREDATPVLGARLDTLPRHVGETRRVPLGVFRGLTFGLVLHPQFSPDVYLEGVISRISMLSREHQGPRAVLNALERLAGGYKSECDRVRQDLAIAEAQLRDYEVRIGQAYLHEAYLTRLTALRDQLKSSLSGAAPEPGAVALPTTSELAERIKLLKSAHTVEPTPNRTAVRRYSAEEPVTTRIRRKAEAVV